MRFSKLSKMDKVYSSYKWEEWEIFTQHTRAAFVFGHLHDRTGVVQTGEIRIPLRQFDRVFLTWKWIYFVAFSPTFTSQEVRRLEARAFSRGDLAAGCSELVVFVGVVEEVRKRLQNQRGILVEVQSDVWETYLWWKVDSKKVLEMQPLKGCFACDGGTSSVSRATANWMRSTSNKFGAVFSAGWVNVDVRVSTWILAWFLKRFNDHRNDSAILLAEAHSDEVSIAVSKILVEVQHSNLPIDVYVPNVQREILIDHEFEVAKLAFDDRLFAIPTWYQWSGR